MEIERLKNKGKTLIYPQKLKKWNELVESSVNDIYCGMDMKNALEIMEALNNGSTVIEAYKILENANHSGWSESIVMNIVTNYSKQGPLFYRASHSNISKDIESYLRELEMQNKKYEKEIKDMEKSC